MIRYPIPGRRVAADSEKKRSGRLKLLAADPINDQKTDRYIVDIIRLSRHSRCEWLVHL